MRPRRRQILREQRPGILGMTLGEGKKGEVATPERRLRVCDDGAEPGDAPARADQCRRGGMLPALELGLTEGDDVRIEKRSTALECGEQPAIDFGERGLECFG